MSKERPLPSKSWTTNLTDEEQKEEFQKRLLQNVDLFRRLAEIVNDKVRGNSRSRIEKKSYEVPAWSEYQADSNGFERGMTEILELLKFTKE